MRAQTVSLPRTAELFVEKNNYYIGTWRRTPYDMMADPLCLNCEGGKAHLTPYDADVGQLFRVIPHAHSPNALILECQEIGESRFLTSELQTSASQGMLACRICIRSTAK